MLQKNASTTRQHGNRAEAIAIHCTEVQKSGEAGVCRVRIHGHRQSGHQKDRGLETTEILGFLPTWEAVTLW